MNLPKNPKSVVIENIVPLVDNGRFPVKREIGDVFYITADIFREGQFGLKVNIMYRKKGAKKWIKTPM